MVYDPAKIAEFWARRPVAVVTRICQLLSIAGGFLSGFLWDLANNKLAENEVRLSFIYMYTCLDPVLFITRPPLTVVRQH